MKSNFRHPVSALVFVLAIAISFSNASTVAAVASPESSSVAYATSENVSDDAKQTNKTLNECQFNAVAFKADFEAARLNGCKQLDDNTYLLTIDAENRPINPSPWYAFSVHTVHENDTVQNQAGENQAGENKSENQNAEQSQNTPQNDKRESEQATSEQKTISIILNAINAQPRYLPKKQGPNGNWEALAFTVINQSPNQKAMKFDLTLSQHPQAEPIKIAAQAIIDNKDYEHWTNKFIETNLYQKVLIGQSTQGRPIQALVKQKSTNHEWVMFIGRMHPPELTGAVAFMTFAEQMNQNTPELNQFYERFNVLMVPNVNPDGVAHGHWRHNVQGRDLNRDWGKFEQVETKVVHDYMTSLLRPAVVSPKAKDQLDGLAKPPKLIFALDFHSTQQDIFYTMPNDHKLAPAMFADEWLMQIKANTVSSFVVRNRPGSKPGKGVFKQFIADTYQVHAVTYEMGDNTSTALVKHVAQVSANTLVEKMLATPANDFNYSSNKHHFNNK